MTHNTTSNSGGGQSLILLCAPSHDETTEYTSKLFDNFPDLGSLTVLRKFKSPLTYDQLLSELSIDPETTQVTVIFCGHGEPGVLLGPGDHPGAPDYSETVSSFYEGSHVPLGPARMLAFCCSSAVGLDDYFERTGGRTFVGFKDDIPLLLEDGDYANCWRGVLHKSASALLNAPDQPKLEKSVRKIYEGALALFPPEKDSVYEWGLWMRFCLQDQVDRIKCIKT